MKILITGGASGLGAAITARLASDNSHYVYFTYCRSKEAAESLIKKFKNTEGIFVDFKSETSIDSFITWLMNSNLEVLINNAMAKPINQIHFHNADPNDFSQGFTFNILPTIRISQAAIKLFRRNKFGKIVTILTSYLIQQKPIGFSEYVASKAYIESLSSYWALENIAFNITVNCISPSFMITGMTENIDERIITDLIQKHPLKNLLTTHEVAEIVHFMINANQHFNGNNILTQ